MPDETPDPSTKVTDVFGRLNAPAAFTPGIVAGLQRQRDRFCEQFGRAPTRDDALFFDPDSDTPVPAGPDRQDDDVRHLVRSICEAGIDPAYVDAWLKVGYVITEANQQEFDPRRKRAYYAAVVGSRAASLIGDGGQP